MAQNDYGGLKHGTHHRLPPKYPRTFHDDYKPKEEFGAAVQQPHRHRIKSPPATKQHPPLQSRFIQLNWASNGPVMQAGLLGSSPKRCGTGVFLPRRTDFRPSTEPGIGKKIDEKLEMKKKEDDVWCSPEIFLPKEWSY